MDPITIGIAGTAVAGGIAQYLNSEQARKANQDEIDRLHDLMERVQQPDFDPAQLSPKDYQLVGKYVPEVAPKITELNPTLIKQSEHIQQGQAAQRAALAQLQGIAGSSSNPELRAMSEEALQSAQAGAQSRQASLLDSFNRRGALDGGVQLAAQLSAGEGSLGRAAAAQQNAAAEAYRQRLSALQQSANLGGQMTAQDANLQAQNASIINAFNQRMANRGQDYANSTADTLNQAQRYNLGSAQDVSNRNTGLANDYGMYNQARSDKNKQQDFNNQMARYGGQVSLANMNMDQNNKGAADRNAAIQGLSNDAMAVGTAYQGSQNNSANRKSAQQTAFFNKYGRAPRAGEYGYDEDSTK